MKYDYKMDGTLELNLNSQDFADDLLRELIDETPWDTGRGAGSIRVTQKKEGRWPKWLVRMNAYLGAQNWGAVIPRRPIWKAAPRVMRWFDGTNWVSKREVAGYTIAPRGFIERAVNRFVGIFTSAIGWQSGKGK